VREDRLRDRGGSAIEVALLLAGMTVVLLPALVLLGHVVYGGFAAPCAAMGNDNCDAQSGGGSSGGGGGSGGGSAGTPTQQLEALVAAQVPDPGGGSSKAKCNHQNSSHPPRGSKANCNVKFSSNGQTRTYSVTWVDDAGAIQIVPA
jgi:Flp pilus assembly pilin Flp